MYILCSTLLHLPPPSDSTVSEDAGIAPRTVATSAVAVRRSSQSVTSHPRLGYILFSLGYISSSLGYISLSLGYFSSSLGYISSSLGYISFSLGYISSSLGYISSSLGYISFSLGYISSSLGYISSSMRMRWRTFRSYHTLYTHHHDGSITNAEPGAEKGDEQELAEEPQDDKVCVQVAVQAVRHLVLQPEEHVPEARVAQLHRVADGEDHH
jgi:hypothetical protein